MNRVHAITKKSWFIPVVLLVVSIAAYGLQISKLGFYWDDWEDVFLYHLGDPSFFWNYFAYDRPFTAWVYVVFFPILQMDPVRWQIFILVLRWLSLVGFWWTFKQLWPRREAEIGWFTLLLSVYPGFTQQAVSVTYSRHFVSYALFSLSLCLMVLSLKKPRFYWLFTVLGAGAAWLQMMTIEYLFGLELLRPFIIWFFDPDDQAGFWKHLWKTIKRWLPYLLALAIFVYWRFVIFASASPDPEANAPVLMANLLKDPLGQILSLVQIIAQDFIYLVLFVWTSPLEPDQIDLFSKSALFSWAVSAALAVSIGWLFLKMRPVDPNGDGKNADQFGWQAALLGVLAILFGGLPVWSTNRQIIVGLWSDRFSIAPMFGAALLVVAIIEIVGYKRMQKYVLAGIILTLAVSSQIRTTNKYRLNWEIQRDYYWQLFWRAPALEPGTAVMGTKMPFGLIADYSVSYALNSIYAPGLQSTRVPYWFFSAMRNRGNEVPDFKDDLPVKYTLRNVVFEGNTSESIVVNYKTGQACVRVLTPADQYSPLLTTDEQTLATISHLEQILPESNPAISPEKIFGPEPEHDWCYYFENADLARQMGDWETAALLGDKAQDLGLAPATGMEWVPFMEGYANTGNWQKAALINDKAFEETNNMQTYLCQAWKRIEQSAPGSDGKIAALEAVRKKLDCAAVNVKSE
ncbi:MAG: hypothetical protein AB9891_11215 [Anaerolineaceae bacterium]